MRPVLRLWPFIILIVVAVSIGLSIAIGTDSSLNRHFVFVLASASVLWSDPLILLVSLIAGALLRNVLAVLAMAIVLGIGTQLIVLSQGREFAVEPVLGGMIAASVDMAVVGALALLWEFMTRKPTEADATRP